MRERGREGGSKRDRQKDRWTDGDKEREREKETEREPGETEQERHFYLSWTIAMHGLIYSNKSLGFGNIFNAYYN